MKWGVAMDAIIPGKRGTRSGVAKVSKFIRANITKKGEEGGPGASKARAGGGGEGEPIIHGALDKVKKLLRFVYVYTREVEVEVEVT